MFGKHPGLNNTTKKEFKKLIKRGHGAVEISDILMVDLSCIVSFMKMAVKEGTIDEDQIGDLTETSDAKLADQVTAQQESLKAAVEEIDSFREVGEAKDAEIDRLKGLLEENEIEHEEEIDPEAEVTG